MEVGQCLVLAEVCGGGKCWVIAEVCGGGELLGSSYGIWRWGSVGFYLK